MNQCTTLAALQEVKDVTEEDAKLIRAVWKAQGITGVFDLIQGNQLALAAFALHALAHTRTVKRWVIDAIIRTCGVESLGIYRGEEVYHCNGGDTYATTILFIGGRLTVGCIGDIQEKRGFREHAQQW